MIFLEKIVKYFLNRIYTKLKIIKNQKTIQINRIKKILGKHVLFQLKEYFLEKENHKQIEFLKKIEILNKNIKNEKNDFNENDKLRKYLKFCVDELSNFDWCSICLKSLDQRVFEKENKRKKKSSALESENRIIKTVKSESSSDEDIKDDKELFFPSSPSLSLRCTSKCLSRFFMRCEILGRDYKIYFDKHNDE